MLDTLPELQDRDTAIDRLRHRRHTMPKRAALDGVRTELTAVISRSA
jgi:predicted  nucleic acid-binding Zn-ribbon protein